MWFTTASNESVLVILESWLSQQNLFDVSILKTAISAETVSDQAGIVEDVMVTPKARVN